jgi:hypothetical protein
MLHVCAHAQWFDVPADFSISAEPAKAECSETIIGPDGDQI